MNLSSKMHDFLKDLAEESFVKDLAHHTFRIAADIAGGDGIGYEEDGLCGNIVKNRWALNHANEVIRLLQKYGETSEQSRIRLQGLLIQASLVKNELEKRIIELRSNVWW